MKALDIRKRLEVRYLLAQGLPQISIARRLGLSRNTVVRINRLFPKPPRCRSQRHLSLEDREEIALGLQIGESQRSIARRLGRSSSTISREIAKQSGHSYRASRGEILSDVACRRPKPRKLENNPKLIQAIEQGLELAWSPEQIAGWLKVTHPKQPSMHVSHETIYKTLYVQGRGELRRELARMLRTQRTRRVPRTRQEGRGHIREMVNISERPAEVTDRAVPGHWEGDLIMGRRGHSAIGTLVERQTRFVMLLHLPHGKKSADVREAMAKKMGTLPPQLRKTLTLDQGSEFSQHARFTVDTNVHVYFCDPHSPWQRGSNENTNGLLRQFFPKGEELAHHTEADLDRVAALLNGRPRQTLGWSTPSKALNELLLR